MKKIIKKYSNKIKKLKTNRKKIIRPIKIKRNEIKNLNYGMIHARVGDRDGVSIVMKQIEDVMVDELKIPRTNITYLVGKSKFKSNRVFKNRILYDATKLRKLTEKEYQTGYGGEISEKLELAINKAKIIIEKYIKKNKLDVIIAHNTCHPVNFILSVALSRYYRDAISKKERTPKYLLWWHDSHLERKVFLHPSRDVERYLIQGIPGDKVEYIFFINSTQYNIAKKYFMKLDSREVGYSNEIHKNHDVIYNTTDTFIDSYDDLESEKFSERIDKFINDFRIRQLLEKRKKTLKDVIFCLQHTRMVKRKRIDFALKYAFALLNKINKNRKNKKMMYFIVSGHDSDGTKKKLYRLYHKLCKDYNYCHNEFHLEFAENYDGKTDIKFEEYPRLIAKLGGFSTYFSEIEGFGNNLLEVLASGLIPVVYTYPVFKTDIAKHKFKLISLKEFNINNDDLIETISLLNNPRKRKMWVNRNLKILRKKLPHRLIAVKLKRGILRKRMHI